MERTKEQISSPPLLNLWVFTSEGLLITHFSNEATEELADADIMAGLLLALTDLAGQLRGSSIQGVILEDRQLYYKRQGDLFAVGETPLDFAKSKQLIDSLEFILGRFLHTQRDMPGFLKLDDFSATKSEIESFLIFNGLLERRETFDQFANEEIIDNVGVVTSQCLSPDGTLIAGSSDRFLKVWNLSRKGAGVFFIEGHESTINAIVDLKDHIVSFSDIGKGIIWDRISWKMVESFSTDYAIQKAKVAPQQKDQLLLMEKNGVALFQMQSRTLIPADYREEPPSLIYSSFVFEGEQILSIHSDGSVFFYSLPSMEIEDTGKIRLAAGDQVNSANFLPLERTFAIITKNGRLIEYDPNRKTSEKLPVVLESGEVSYSVFDSQLDALVLGFQNGSIAVFLPFSRREKAFRIQFKAHNDPVAFFGYLFRQDICVTCSTNRDIRIWNNVQFRDAIKILQAGNNKLENVYRNLKEIVEWLERCRPAETEGAARKMLMKARLYNSRIASYERVLELKQPWWLRLALKKELGEAKDLLEKARVLLTTFETEIRPKIDHLVGEEEEEEEDEKISLDSIPTY